MKCKNFECTKEMVSKSGYCRSCLHSSNSIVAKCGVCGMTYNTTIGMEKKYCSTNCRTLFYKLKNRNIVRSM